MATYAENTSVTSDRSRAEIERTLQTAYEASAAAIAAAYEQNDSRPFMAEIEP